LCICFLFVAQIIEGQIFVSFWDTNKYTDTKKDAKQLLNLTKLLCTWNILLSVTVAVAVAVAIAVAEARIPLFSLLVSKMYILDNLYLF
jgi:hypothetical protein